LTVDGKHPTRRGTIFRIASITRPMIAAATMMRVDDGNSGSAMVLNAGCRNLRIARLCPGLLRLQPEIAERRRTQKCPGALISPGHFELCRTS
jgi:hypothetical protein